MLAHAHQRVVPAKAGTHTPCPLHGLRAMGPGASAGTTTENCATLSRSPIGIALPHDPAAAPALERAGVGPAAPSHAPWQQSKALGRLDHLLARITEIPAAILVAVETLVLLAGVISRYGFNRPLTWSDEL